MSDFDGDGFPDVFEYNAGSNPSNSASRPAPSFVVDHYGFGTHYTIQEALDAVTQDFTLIEVHPGSYYENIDLGNHRVMLYSTPGFERTYLGGFIGGPAIQVRSDSIIQGFVISNTTNQDSNGGGLALYSCSARISNCIFKNNYAVQGGAISNYGGSSLIANCTFVGNEASTGAAIFQSSGSMLVRGCVFLGNVSTEGSPIAGTGLDVRFSVVQGAHPVLKILFSIRIWITKDY